VKSTWGGALLVLGVSVATIAIATPYRYGAWLDPSAAMVVGGLTLNYGTGLQSALMHLTKIVFVAAIVPAWRKSCWAGVICAVVCTPLVVLSVWNAVALLALQRSARVIEARVAQGCATPASRAIEQHLLDAETARLRHQRLADRWWGPLAHATLEQYFEVRREAVARVKACRDDSAALLVLLDNAIATFQEAPERTFERMARRGRLDPNSQFVTNNVAKFWTEQLGRRREDLKGMIALASVVWRLIGQPKSPQAIREAFARHLERL